MTDKPRGISVVIDADHGGRWTSLRSGAGREWLWNRHIPERANVRPGDAFVDAGGLEECIPTVGGLPDHGDAWARAWRPDGPGLAVDGDGYRLQRRIQIDGDVALASYRLSAPPGWRFIWAAHALLDLSTSARLYAPSGHPARIAGGEKMSAFLWPWFNGDDLSTLGDVDGTARMITLPDLRQITVADQNHRLTMAISALEAPVSVAIWRNLGGWPNPVPYRSIGVEPMLGRIPRLSAAQQEEAAVVPASGQLSWSLKIRAHQT